MSVNERFKDLCSLRRDIARVESAMALLDWDMETIMPPQGAAARAETSGALAGIVHEKLTASVYGDIVQRLYDVRSLLPEPWQRRTVELEFKRWRRASKLPVAFVREMTRLTSAAHHEWVDAKRSSDYPKFAPTLGRIVRMKLDEASILGGTAKHPYDVLLDEYEPGATVEELTPIFDALTGSLTPFLQRIVEARGVPSDSHVTIPARLEAQQRIVRRLAETFNYDFGRGCMGVTEHPFMTTIHAGDSRVAVAYKPEDVCDGVYSIIHEVGHGLYEQGLPTDRDGLGIGLAVSLGVHESQSRLWENMVGRSRAFAPRLLHMLQEEGEASGISDDGFYRILNQVRPSYVRTEADEVTYNLHVALRFDIERRLFDGSLAIDDVRDAWNAKMLELFGLEVKDDAKGVLQDVHWSAGLFGYFPTYALGNMYAAQLYASAGYDIPDLEHRIAKGDLGTLLGWLREKIHRHGSMYQPRELIRRATGRDPDPSFFIAHIERKYGELYGL